MKNLIHFILFCIFSVGIVLYAQTIKPEANQYIFSLTQNKTLCVGNQVNNGGTFEMQMRCYDTTVSVPSYRFILNTSIYDTTLTKAGDITCLFKFNDPTRTTVQTQCAGDIKDTNGNITGETSLLNTTFSLP